jgi:hypothetical protein
MNDLIIRRACIAIGMQEPISIEPDGTVWVGADDDRTYPDMNPILAKAEELVAEHVNARQSARTKLAALGLTEAEINTLIGV